MVKSRKTLSPPQVITGASVLLVLLALVHVLVIVPIVLFHPEMIQGLWIIAIAFHVAMVVVFPWLAILLRQGSRQVRNRVTRMLLIIMAVGTFFVLAYVRNVLYFQLLLAVALPLEGATLALLWLPRASRRYFAKEQEPMKKGQ
jgi:hypothetical protein